MIRRGGADDADAVAAVFTPSFATLAFLPRLHTAAEDRGFIRNVVLAEHEVWVAEEDSRIVAFASLSDEKLEHLYVHPDAHGRGIGATLLVKAKERRPQGFEFWVFQKNDGARRFYERHGCRLVTLTDGADNEYGEPDALYEWRP